MKPDPKSHREAPETPQAPIFILAPQARTGTNYLWELLRRHPSCAPGRPPIWEDYFLIHAPRLVRFAGEAQASWDPSWGPTRHLRADLLRHLGDGIVSFLTSNPDRRLVTKSPTIANLDVFFDLFPAADLLLLVRDGRDVAASGMKTFGWTLEDAARSWAWGVDTVLDFVAAHRDERVRIVRFEHLVDEPQEALSDLLAWLGLDPAAYDFEALADVPVRGSSSYRGEGADGVHWRPLPRRPEFRPVGRWASWTEADLAAFDRIAGPHLDRLDYPRPPVPDPEPLRESRVASRSIR